MTAEEITREFPHVSLAQVHAALSYFFDHRDEIWNDLKEDAAYVKRMKQQQEEREEEIGKNGQNGEAGDGAPISS